MSDEAFEAMGQAEMLVTELKAKMSILEIAAAAECKEDDIPCVDDAIEAAGGAENATEEPPAEKEKAPKVKKSEQWWVAEDLSIDDAVTVIAERLSEAEASFEKAKAEKVSREEKYAAAVQSAEDAKERAQAADQRAADAMTAVEEMMERVSRRASRGPRRSPPSPSSTRSARSSSRRRAWRRRRRGSTPRSSAIPRTRSASRRSSRRSPRTRWRSS